MFWNEVTPRHCIYHEDQPILIVITAATRLPHVVVGILQGEATDSKEREIVGRRDKRGEHEGEDLEHYGNRLNEVN